MPELAVLDDLVDLMSTDELGFDPRCTESIGLAVDVRLSILNESRELEPEPGLELSWPEMAVEST